MYTLERPCAQVSAPKWLIQEWERSLNRNVGNFSRCQQSLLENLAWGFCLNILYNGSKCQIYRKLSSSSVPAVCSLLCYPYPNNFTKVYIIFSILYFTFKHEILSSNTKFRVQTQNYEIEHIIFSSNTKYGYGYST